MVEYNNIEELEAREEAEYNRKLVRRLVNLANTLEHRHCAALRPTYKNRRNFTVHKSWKKVKHGRHQFSSRVKHKFSVSEQFKYQTFLGPSCPLTDNVQLR